MKPVLEVTPPLHGHRPLVGALCIVGAALMLATVATLVKLAMEGLPSTMAVFFRSFFSLLILSLLVLRRGVVRTLRTSHWRLHLFRTLFGLSAMYGYFYAIHSLTLAHALLLSFTAPLFIPFVARVWLKEPLSPGVLVAVGVGFAGVMAILRPGALPMSPGAWAGLASGLLAAVMLVCIRRMAATEPTTRIVFYFGLGATLLAAFPLLRTWQTPTNLQWLYLLGAGTGATVGQLLMTRGYAYAPAAQMAPFHYTAVIFAAASGWMVWGDRLDAWTATGALLICLAGILAARGNRPTA